MLCQVCHQPGLRFLCDRCRTRLRPASERVLGEGLRLVAAFEHTGPAARLIHHLKYRGVGGYEELVAETLARRLPNLPIAPVPRALSRRLKYGVDPTRLLADALARRMGVPVLSLLLPPIHNPRRAGGDHQRPVPRFRVRRGIRFPIILLDDVVTTGATILSAASSIGGEVVALAVAANVVPTVSTLR